MRGEGAKTLCLAGGVGASFRLRKARWISLPRRSALQIEEAQAARFTEKPALGRLQETRASTPTTEPATIRRKWWPASVTAGWSNYYLGPASGAQQSMLSASAASTTSAQGAAATSRGDTPTTAGDNPSEPYCSAPGRVCFLFVSFLCRTCIDRGHGGHMCGDMVDTF